MRLFFFLHIFFFWREDSWDADRAALAARVAAGGEAAVRDRAGDVRVGDCSADCSAGTPPGGARGVEGKFLAQLAGP